MAFSIGCIGDSGLLGSGFGMNLKKVQSIAGTGYQYSAKPFIVSGVLYFSAMNGNTSLDTYVYSGGSFTSFATVAIVPGQATDQMCIYKILSVLYLTLAGVNGTYYTFIWSGTNWGSVVSLHWTSHPIVGVAVFTSGGNNYIVSCDSNGNLNTAVWGGSNYSGTTYISTGLKSLIALTNISGTLYVSGCFSTTVYTYVWSGSSWSSSSSCVIGSATTLYSVASFSYLGNYYLVVPGDLADNVETLKWNGSAFVTYASVSFPGGVTRYITMITKNGVPCILVSYTIGIVGYIGLAYFTGTNFILLSAVIVTSQVAVCVESIAFKSNNYVFSTEVTTGGVFVAAF